MKDLLTTAVLITCLSVAGLAQNRSDSTGNRPLINEQTKQAAQQKAVKVEEKIDDEIEKSRNYMQDNQLSWFQPGTVFGGGGLGFGATGGKVYTDIDLRIGYFFQPGFAAGLRYDYDRLIGNKYHARQAGLFARYYPFRTRISSFVGGSLSGGREFSDNIASDQKATYTSVGLEAGVMFWVLHQLGAEISYEGNFYNKFDDAVGRGKGGRLKLGVNYYFGRVGSRGFSVTK